VERILQLDTKYKSMECNLQAGNKQNKEEPSNDNFEKSIRITHVQPQRNGEGYVRDYLIPKDDQTDDTNYHKGIRAQSKEPILTADDRDYTPTEVKNAICDLMCNKAPGEDGTAAEIY